MHSLSVQCSFVTGMRDRVAVLSRVYPTCTGANRVGGVRCDLGGARSQRLRAVKRSPVIAERIEELEMAGRAYVSAPKMRGRDRV